MWYEVTDLFWPLVNIKFFPAVVIACTVATAFMIIRLMTESTTLAVVFTPMMAVSALASNYLFNQYYLGPLNDKDSNILIAAAVGVLVAMLFMLLATRCAIGMSDRRRRKKSAKLAGAVRLQQAPVSEV